MLQCLTYYSLLLSLLDGPVSCCCCCCCCCCQTLHLQAILPTYLPSASIHRSSSRFGSGSGFSSTVQCSRDSSPTESPHSPEHISPPTHCRDPVSPSSASASRSNRSRLESTNKQQADLLRDIASIRAGGQEVEKEGKEDRTRQDQTGPRITGRQEAQDAQSCSPHPLTRPASRRRRLLAPLVDAVTRCTSYLSLGALRPVSGCCCCCCCCCLLLRCPQPPKSRPLSLAQTAQTPRATRPCRPRP